MAPLAEIVRALYGVWRILHFDRGALAFFDLSVGGAIRSFTAAAIIAPFYAVLTALRFELVATGTSAGRYVLVQAIAYVLSWVFYPVVIEALTRQLSCRDRFPAYLCVYNWTMVLQNGLVIVLALLNQLGLLPVALAGLLGFGVLVLTGALLWFIARVVLAVPPLTAFGFIVLDFLISILITTAADAVL